MPHESLPRVESGHWFCVEYFLGYPLRLSFTHRGLYSVHHFVSNRQTSISNFEISFFILSPEHYFGLFFFLIHRFLLFSASISSFHMDIYSTLFGTELRKVNLYRETLCLQNSSIFSSFITLGITDFSFVCPTKLAKNFMRLSRMFFL